MKRDAYAEVFESVKRLSEDNKQYVLGLLDGLHFYKLQEKKYQNQLRHSFKMTNEHKGMMKN